MVDLTYFKMVMMTMPYTIMLTLAGLAGILTMDFHE
jgi:Na+/H+ antiporter NhaB